jgi:hypothetical protein
MDPRGLNAVVIGQEYVGPSARLQRHHNTTPQTWQNEANISDGKGEEAIADPYRRLWYPHFFPFIIHHLCLWAGFFYGNQSGWLVIMGH